MEHTYTKIICLLILAFAFSGCGTGSPTEIIVATETETMNQIATTTESPTINTQTPDTHPEVADSPTTELTTAITENKTLIPTNQVTNNGNPTKRSSGPLCNDSVFVEDVSIPDGTILLPEKNFIKTWRLKNTGTCRWTTSYAIGYAYGNRMEGIETKLPNVVDPGFTVDVSVEMTSPKENGWYPGWWRLKSEDGSYFGDFVYVSILVSNGQETSTPSY
jgi:hypothetical protein